MSLREGCCRAVRAMSTCVILTATVLLASCGDPFAGDPPLTRAASDETQETQRQQSSGRSIENPEAASREAEGKTGALQSPSRLGGDLDQRRGDTFDDESIPPPAGLMDQSGPIDQGSGYASAESRFRMNERHRARIDQLKRRLEHMADGPEKDRLLRELDEVSAAYRATRDGLIDTATVMGREEARGMTDAQRKRLLRLMAGYDMSKPSDVAEWNRVKSEELGR
jgi:hypothetical protein